MLPQTRESFLVRLMTGREAAPPSPLDAPDPVDRMWNNLPAMPSRFGAQVTAPSRESFDPLLPRAEGFAGVPTTRGEAERTSRLADLVLGFAGTTPVTRGIRAFHGSPHAFDRFDISRIGTGEGAQAYGHGLYFAASEDVARYYREKLAGTQLGAMQDAMSELPDALRQRATSALFYDRMAPEEVADLLSLTRAGGAIGRDNLLATFRRAASAAPPAGSMYEVNLRTSPERLLDWDAPLSAQPGPVREALNEALRWQKPAQEALATHRAAYGEPTGAHVYNALEGVMRRDPRGAQFAAEELRANNIDGIQYLDAGSRAAGGGSRNYVMFDDALIDIVRRYGMMPFLFGFGAAAGAGNAGETQ